jgi:hypothetical protein
LTGWDGSKRISKIYKNSRYPDYELSESQTLLGVEYSSVAWGDYDNDGDLDLVLTGHNVSEAVSKIFENDESESGSNHENMIPSPPNSLVCTYSDGKLILIWSDAVDNETTSHKKTSSPGLYYNLRVRSEPGADDLVAARYGSPLLGNFLSKKKPGNQNMLTFGVYGKGYYWSVQTIDTTLGFS